ncbi:MAG: TetR/AcrR family transcriptional regulator C-terminal domain-containing protein [Bauldia sp.]|nr:TetR/AcrR family transcriptional regulator C-terminal domain-containing protein [Bauldia sp.]
MTTTSHDPRRSLALLWGQPGRAGRSGLSIGWIVEAAVKLADAEGLAALSMRRLAADLGVGTMALYTHVPGKEALLDVMFDAVLGEFYRDAPPREKPGGWQAGLRSVAEENWAAYQRHPWAFELGPRPALGPNTVRKYDLELGPLEGIGLTFVEMNEALSLVLNHVAGVARIAWQLAEERKRTGLSDADWWAQHEPVMAAATELMPYQLASRVGQAASEAANGLYDPKLAFEFGVDRIIDGIGVLVARRAPTATPATAPDAAPKKTARRRAPKA